MTVIRVNYTFEQRQFVFDKVASTPKIEEFFLLQINSCNKDPSVSKQKNNLFLTVS